MKIRTQLSLGFILLAVVPLVGIVLFSYLSSKDAFHEAVEAESLLLAEEIERGLESAKKDVQRRVERIGGRFELTDANRWESESFLEELRRNMGDVGLWLDSLQFVARQPDAVVVELPPGEAPSAADAPRAPEAQSLTDWKGFGDLWLIVEETAELVASDDDTPAAAKPWLRALRHAAGSHNELKRQRLEVERGRLDREIEELSVELLEQREEASSERGDVDPHLALDQAIETSLLEARIETLAQRRAQMTKLLGGGFSSPIRRGDRVVGDLVAAVQPSRLIGKVLRETPRDQGEIPFAVDSGGRVYTSQPSEREALGSITCLDGSNVLEVLEEFDDEEPFQTVDDWVIVTKEDPATELTFGIARPVAESLASMQAASVRNLIVGVLLISIAVFGIWPLTRRMTRRLSVLTDGVEALSAGDLGARVTPSGNDEISKLAVAFNRMAGDLDRNQQQLLEQERREQQAEVERRILEAENERKTTELEEARTFQLGLLPEALPDHPEYELGVFMRTATEVGGDYYDFDVGENGELTLVIGDATGHGAKAGTMVTVVKSLFSSRVKGASPESFLCDACRSIAAMRLGRMAMAALVARLDGGTMEVSAAGMPPTLIYRSGGGLDQIELESFPLGIGRGDGYPSRRIDLDPGDSVLFMTDGFPELLDDSGEPLGYAAVADLFASIGDREPEGVISRLSTVLRERTGGASPSDDVTFVVVRRRSR